MTVLESLTTDQATEFVTEEGDHDKEAHIVIPAHSIYVAMVMGTTVTALCGKTWTPTRDPERFSVCKMCIEAFERDYGKWEGQR